MAGRIARGQIARGDVRLYEFAAPDKKRPVLVLTRDSAIAYLSTVTVAPVTSTIRGVPSEVVLNEEDGMKSPCAVNLHNAVTVSQQRLGKRVAQLSSARMNEVCAALRFSLGLRFELVTWNVPSVTGFRRRIRRDASKAGRGTLRYSPSSRYSSEPYDWSEAGRAPIRLSAAEKTEFYRDFSPGR